MKEPLIDSSVTYQADLKRTAEVLSNKELLRGRSILITGGTGLICSAVIDLLLYCNRLIELDVEIYVAGRNEQKMRSRFPQDRNLHFLNYDANQPIQFNIGVDYIIHGASNANPEAYLKCPVETMTGNIFGAYSLLNYSMTHGVKRLLYISSSEVYGKKESPELFEENQYGFVDVLETRSCYPSAKRATETLCVAYMSEYKVDSVIVRPGHIYGPTARPQDERISALFARVAARGENLVLKSDGGQVRSYCYCLDCATAILTVLTRGTSGEAYNISNRKSILDIRTMARLLADAGGVSVQFTSPEKREKALFQPMNNSALNGEKLETLGWRCIFDAETGFLHTVKIIQELDRGMKQ